MTDNGGMSSPESDAAPTESGTVERREVRIRRAPRIGVFLVLGGVLGVLATLVLTSLFEADPHVGFAASFGYFVLYGLPAGVLLGALVALLLDAISRRRARTVTVEHDVVDGPPA